eukprot:2037216-Rhodomonas_salina.1
MHAEAVPHQHLLPGVLNLLGIPMRPVHPRYLAPTLRQFSSLLSDVQALTFLTPTLRWFHPPHPPVSYTHLRAHETEADL